MADKPPSPEIVGHLPQIKSDPGKGKVMVLAKRRRDQGLAAA
ncbi:MAG: hypothetical protein ACK4Z8_02450 [Novosphingobium sp.]